MPKRVIAVSRASRDAIRVLGNQIKVARLKRGWSQRELAERIHVDSRTISAIEGASPGVAVGTVFNAAFTVGVDLFGLDGDELALARRRGEEVLRLLPQHGRGSASTDGNEMVDDDF